MLILNAWKTASSETFKGQYCVMKTENEVNQSVIRGAFQILILSYGSHLCP